MQPCTTKMNLGLSVSGGLIFALLSFAMLFSLFFHFNRLLRADLREIADRFPEASSLALSDAAMFYDEEIKAVVKLVNICREHKSFTESTRQAAVVALNATLDAEKKAIGKIEAALANLQRK